MPPSPQNKYYSSKKEDVICYNNPHKVAQMPGSQLQSFSFQPLHADSMLQAAKFQASDSGVKRQMVPGRWDGDSSRVRTVSSESD